MSSKGIILAGGSGTRLYPLSVALSKQLMPVFDKPMIYYPLSTLMSSGIRDILIITTPHDKPQFQNLLKDGSQWGVSIEYAEQSKPEGIAQAFIIGEKFINNESCTLILGDNIFYGEHLSDVIGDSIKNNFGATIFGYRVSNPSAYGVVELDGDKVINIEEKPLKPKTNFAVTGLYVYDKHVVEFAHTLKPSKRGEFEITDLNNVYIERGLMSIKILGRGSAWLDTGTHESLLQASNFVQTIQIRQGLMISCPEEIAFNNGWITEEQVLKNVTNSNYGTYLVDLVRKKNEY